MAARVKLAWHGAAFERAVADEVVKRMVQAESLAVRTYQANVATPYPPPSMPGQFPHLRTGRLQASVRANVNMIRGDRVQLAITNSARYAAALETGTKRMAARPHLRPTLQMVFSAVKRLLNAT